MAGQNFPADVLLLQPCWEFRTFERSSPNAGVRNVGNWERRSDVESRRKALIVQIGRYSKYLHISISNETHTGFAGSKVTHLSKNKMHGYKGRRMADEFRG